jgi:hypothetical protein
MECLEFRRAAGADPCHLDAGAEAHRDGCPRCAEFLRQTLALDEKVLAALRIPVPEVGARPWRPSAAVRPLVDHRRWLALAASIVGGVAIGSLLWVSSPRESLATALVEHMDHEPEALGAETPADPARVERVLGRGGIRLKPGIGAVSYANTCPFRGRRVPHLVVQTDAGPVTVIVLGNEKVEAPVRFDEQGYSGTIMPAGPGSIAVVGTAHANLDQVAGQVLAAVEWTRD